jgi:hypothetical protein
MKFLVAVVLLACASTATAGLFDFKKPAYKPVCTKGCKKDYDVCKPVEVEEEQCPKPVYVAPVYKGKYGYGRKLNNYKPKYTPAPTPAPVCKKVKVVKQVCTKAPCTVTELVDKTTCELVCDAKTGRKLSNYKPKYAPVYVAPKPKCENKCTTVKVPVTKCLDQCVYDICPSPKPVPVYKPKPIFHKPTPTPAPTPAPEHKPKYDIEDIKDKIKGLISKHDD